jgi:uncharacterized protein YjbI with pentapeptide repeats
MESPVKLSINVEGNSFSPSSKMRFIFVATVVLLPLLYLSEQVKAENPDPIQQLRQSNKCPNCDLSGADLTGTRLAEADLSGANLRGARLGGPGVIAADLRYANLKGADLSGADLRGVVLEGANLTDAKLEKAMLVGAYLRFSNLEGANLVRANLSDADLRNAKLTRTLFNDAVLTGVIGYEGATLPKSRPEAAGSSTPQGTSSSSQEREGFRGGAVAGPESRPPTRPAGGGTR